MRRGDAFGDGLLGERDHLVAELRRDLAELTVLVGAERLVESDQDRMFFEALLLRLLLVTAHRVDEAFAELGAQLQLIGEALDGGSDRDHSDRQGGEADLEGHAAPPCCGWATSSRLRSQCRRRRPSSC